LGGGRGEGGHFHSGIKSDIFAGGAGNPRAGGCGDDPGDATMLSAIVSALHLLALAIGLPSVFLRGRALKGTFDGAALRRLLTADLCWGIAFVLWLITGLARAFGGLEKGSEFYLHSSLFWTKMALIGVVTVLELWPMLTFMRWRRDIGHGQVPDTSGAHALYVVNHIQMVLVVVIVFVASFMARGFG
jgi:putative membrane protein